MNNNSDNDNSCNCILLRDLMNSLANLDNNDNDNDKEEEKVSVDNLNNNETNNNSSENNKDSNRNINPNSNCNCNSIANGVINESSLLSSAFYIFKIPAINKDKAIPLVPLYLLPTNDDEMKAELESLQDPHILDKLLKIDPNLARVVLEEDGDLLSKYFANERDSLCRMIRREQIRRRKINQSLSEENPQRKYFLHQKVERLASFVITHLINCYLDNVDNLFGYVRIFYIIFFCVE